MPVIVLILLLLILLYLLTGLFFALRLLKIRRHTTDFTIRNGLEYKEFDEDFLQSDKTDFVIPKADGGYLDGFALPGNSGHTVIFCHGVTWTRYGMVKYFDYFRENGWNIIAYDHQAHGKSTGKYPTYGVSEKRDLKLVVDWALKQFPETEDIGLFGESMGAATVLQYAPMDSRINFIIADCPYSNFNTLMNHQLKLFHIPRFLRAGIIRLSDGITRRIAGFHTGNINPEKDILKTDVPILLIHGRKDDYVPTAMSEQMYRIRKEKAPTQLVLIEGAAHARSVKTDPEHYRRGLEEFMDTVIKNKSIEF